MNPDTTPQPLQPQCTMEDLGVTTFDGMATQGLLFRHSDGFACLRIVEVDQEVDEEVDSTGPAHDTVPVF